MVVILALLSLVVLGFVHATAREQDVSVRRIEAIQSYYAAEAGLNMAVREFMENADSDGDGAIATISDDSNDANDPALGAANVVVTQALSGANTILTSTGRSGQSQRVLQVTVQ